MINNNIPFWLLHVSWNKGSCDEVECGNLDKNKRISFIGVYWLPDESGGIGICFESDFPCLFL